MKKMYNKYVVALKNINFRYFLKIKFNKKYLEIIIIITIKLKLQKYEFMVVIKSKDT